MSATYTFNPTKAVSTARARQHFVDCAVCKSNQSDYLFYRAGVRFVRCRSCALVYTNPVGGAEINYFDIDRHTPFTGAHDRQLLVSDFEQFLGKLVCQFAQQAQPKQARAVLLGRSMPEFVDGYWAKQVALQTCIPTQLEFERLVLDSDLSFAKALFEANPPNLVILHEFLEACANPQRALESISAGLGPDAWVVVTFANVNALPARWLRRFWTGFFDVKRVFFNAQNLAFLASSLGLELEGMWPFPVTRSLGYLARRLGIQDSPVLGLTPDRVLRSGTPVPLGHQVAIFSKRAHSAPEEKLSIIMPVYNEARYVQPIIEAVLARQLKIPKELIIVESNSQDGSRDLVRKFENHPEVRLIFEDKPRGKGHAVRQALAVAKGSIVLIQDADFEYDINDYDALLEPILQHKTEFVLGSRSLGLDDWKVRQFARGQSQALAMNLAQIAFAKTFNALYQQRTTDVNTMFKVFRRKCLQNIDLEGNGFDFDIELVCKLVKAGHAPLEIPINYVARDFAQGKKIRFFRDAWPSYRALFQYRLGRST